MKLLDGIPQRRVLFDFIGSIVWSAFNCLYINVLSQLTSNSNKEDLLKISLFYFGYLLLWEITEYISDVHSDITLTTIENNVTSKYFEKIYDIKPSVLKEYNTGYISGLLSKLGYQQGAAYKQAALFFPLSIIYVCYFTYRMGSFHYSFGVALLLLVMTGVIFQVTLNHRNKKYTNASSVADAERSRLFIDVVSNIGTTQKMQAKEIMKEKISQKSQSCINKKRAWSLRNEVAFCGFKYIIYLYAPICLLLYQFVPVEIDTIAFLSLLAVLCIQLVHTSKSIAITLIEYQKFLSVRSRLDEIIDSKNIRKKIDESNFLSASIENMDYTYKEGKKNVHIVIPNFHVNKGDKICISGESGQGKTTLLHLLSGEIETDAVSINGEKAKKRLNCVFISQDTEIFDMTVRDNLTLGKNISDEKILYYMEMTGLKDWLDHQKDGLNTRLGERGVFVSTGQRQRLNLIRGLLIEDKEIYLLDEPTSNVDEQTEEKMINLIKEVLKNKTVIIVTHRPKIKTICNRNYVFKDSVLREI